MILMGCCWIAAQPLPIRFRSRQPESRQPESRAMVCPLSPLSPPGKLGASPLILSSSLVRLHQGS